MKMCIHCTKKKKNLGCPTSVETQDQFEYHKSSFNLKEFLKNLVFVDRWDQWVSTPWMSVLYSKVDHFSLAMGNNNGHRGNWKAMMLQFVRNLRRTCIMYVREAPRVWMEEGREGRKKERIRRNHLFLDLTLLLLLLFSFYCS